MNIKTLLTFVFGLGIGAGTGILTSKKYFENKYQELYEKDRDALEKYYERVDQYTRGNLDEDEEDDGVNPVGDRESGVLSSEERKMAKENIKNNKSFKSVNYSGFYKNDETRNNKTAIPIEKPDKPTSILDDMEICANCRNYDPENDSCALGNEDATADYVCDYFQNIHEDNKTPEEEAFDEHQKNRNKPPRIISAEAYSNLPAYIENEVLYFYKYDEMLVDENDEPVEEPERLVGDALTKYSFVDNDESIIFVMNYSIDTCYEVQKVDSSWTDSH